MAELVAEMWDAYNERIAPTVPQEMSPQEKIIVAGMLDISRGTSEVDRQAQRMARSMMEMFYDRGVAVANRGVGQPTS